MICGAVSEEKGRVCHLQAGHPSPVHMTFEHGWPQPWMQPTTDVDFSSNNVPDDPYVDAPEALRKEAHDDSGSR